MIFRRSTSNKVSLKLNLFFNFISGVWTAALGILFVPIYLKYIGIEAYGIIGFFTSLQAFLYLLDLGLSPTFNREVARLSAAPSPETAEKIRTLTKTLENLNWATTIVIGLILIGLSPVLARYWVQAGSLSITDVTQSFLIMSVASAVQFPASLYTGGLAGLQRQVASNIILITCGTLRSLGAIFVLHFVSPTIQAFLIWQAFISLLQTVLSALVFYAGIPRSPNKPKFDREIVRQLWQFAAGNAGISLIALLLMQIDKIVLSKMISLEDFGYYSLATMVSSMALIMLTSVVTKVAFPQFSSIIALNDEAGLSRAYHRYSQLVAVLVIPTTAVLAFFSKEILYLWTRNETIADRTSLLLTLGAIGTGAHCLMWVPHYMALAYGWTKLSFYKDLIAILIFIPLLFLLVSRYGAIGGVLGWMILSLSNFTLYIWLLHRRILKGELIHWYLWDIGVPLLSTLSVIIICRLLLKDVFSLGTLFIYLSIIGLLSLTVAALSAYSVRQTVFQYLSGILLVKKAIN